MQRLRVRFSKIEPLKFLSHLDLLRLWERALRRAELPLAYSEGFNPHPRLSFAAPLPVGITSDVELLDVYLSRWIAPMTFATRLKRQLPRGIELKEVRPCPLDAPSLPAIMSAVEYRINVRSPVSKPQVGMAIQQLLESRTIPWSHSRGNETRAYDLRPLIEDIRIESMTDHNIVISMRLRCDMSGTGRPEHVLQALGLTAIPDSIHRTRLITKTDTITSTTNQ